MCECKRDKLTSASIIILDFDGTLVRLETDWKALKMQLTEDCKERYGFKEEFKELDSALCRIRCELGLEVYYRLVRLISEHEITGFKGKINYSLIEEVKSSGKKAAIFSKNCAASIRQILASLDFRVNYIIGKEDVSHPKPHPEGLLKILDNFSAHPTEAIFIGDSELDLLAGQAAGIRTLLVGDSFE